MNDFIPKIDSYGLDEFKPDEDHEKEAEDLEHVIEFEEHPLRLIQDLLNQDDGKFQCPKKDHQDHHA